MCSEEVIAARVRGVSLEGEKQGCGGTDLWKTCRLAHITQTELNLTEL